MKRWLVIGVLAVVGCKDKEGPATVAPPVPASNDSATAQAASAAVALAQAAAALAAAASAAPAATPSADASAAPAASATPSGFSAQLENQLGRLGFATGSSDLVALGRDRGALLAGLARLTAEPSALSALFGNDSVVTAFMGRADTKQFCRDPERLKQVLLFALSSPSARVWVKSPAAIKALTGSKLGQQFRGCSAFKTLAQDPQTLATLVKGNAQASAVVNDANFRAELDRLKIRQDAQGARVFTKRR